MFNGIWRDLGYAARSLARARAFTCVCVVSLGIGMVPVVTVPYLARILKTPPPGVKTAGLVEVITTPRGARAATSSWSYLDFEDLRAADTGMAIAGWTGGPSTTAIHTSAGVEMKSVPTLFVSANYFKTIGIALARGPGFDAAVDNPLKAEPAVILGYGFWQTQFGSDPDVIGKTLTLDDIPHVVVGVAPESFDGHLFLHGKELFVPLEQHPLLRNRDAAANVIRSDRDHEWIYVVGRLAPGVAVTQASAAVATVTTRLAKEHPATNELKAGIVVAYDPMGNLEHSQFRIVQAVAMTLTGTVLLVVCLNISGMMQVRSAMRERELSIRQAIGASRGRLMQHLWSEAVIVAALGGALTAVVLANLPAVVVWVAGQPLPPQVQPVLRMDLSIVAVCVALCFVTSVVFGLLPATRFSRPAIISSLKDDAGVGGFRAGRVHRVTVALQVAIAVPLIVMSGISLDRVRATATSDLGFESELLYAAPLKLEGDANEAAFRIRSAQDHLGKTGGIASVTVADGLPLDFRGRMTRVSLDAEANVAPRIVPVQVTRVGDGYLDTMRIPLVRGRDFTGDDRAGSEKVTIISKPLAEQLFPNADAADAIGQRLRFGADEKTKQTLTIVGVTADFPTAQMSTERPQLLLPLAQHSNIRGDSVPVEDDNEGLPNVMLIARSAAGESPAKLTAALEGVAREFDPEFRTASVVTGVWLRKKSVEDFLTQSAVAAVAGGVILMLAALGVYGVVGLMVATRTREIAVRTALGASHRRVIGMILFDVVKLVVPGVIVGMVLTAVLNRLNAENMGISLSNVEPLAYVAGAGVAVLVAILASLVPARWAASVQPLVAMRTE